MQNEQLKTILYEYANTKGLGLPLTAEQCLNAMSSWLVDTLPECIDVNVVTLATGEEPYVTLTGNGTPDDHYIFTFGLPAGIQGDKGEDGQAYVGFYNGTMIPVTGQYYDYTTYSAYITWTNNSAPEVGSPFIIQWIQNTNDTTYMVVGYRADTQSGVSGDWLYFDGASIIDGKSICLGTVSSNTYPDEGQYITDDIKWITTKPVTNDSFWLMYSYTSSSDTSYYTFAVLGTYDGVYYKINSLSNIQGATGATGATGVQGIEGLSIYDVADEVTTSGASILITAFTVPSGYSVKVGDLCLGTDGIVGQVESLTSTTATVRYVLTLQGGGTTGNYVTVDTEQTVTGYKTFEQGVYYGYTKYIEDSLGTTGYLLLGTIYFKDSIGDITISVNRIAYICHYTSTQLVGFNKGGISTGLRYDATDNSVQVYIQLSAVTAPYYFYITNMVNCTFEPNFSTISTTAPGTPITLVTLGNTNVQYLNYVSGSLYQLISNTPLANSYTYTYYFRLGTSSSTNGCVFTFSLNFGDDQSSVMTDTGTTLRITSGMLEGLGYSEYADEDDYGYYPANGVFYNASSGLSYQIIGVYVGSGREFDIVYVSNDSTSTVVAYDIYDYSNSEMMLTPADCRVIISKNTGSITPTITKLHYTS